MQIFVLDHREYPSESLLRPKLDHLQGPALLAYNDTVFSVADWEAIRTVSQSSKSSDSEFVLSISVVCSHSQYCSGKSASMVWGLVPIIMYVRCIVADVETLTIRLADGQPSISFGWSYRNL